MLLPSQMKDKAKGGGDYESTMKKGMARGGPPMPGGGDPGAKAELPIKYASADKTPITVKVPPPEKLIKIELSSK